MLVHVRKLKERNYSEDLGTDGRITKNGSYRNRVGSCELDSSQDRDQW
jgi:hypothetical protein